MNFPSKRLFSLDILPSLVEKTKQLYVFPTLAECYFAIAYYDFWMFKKAYDVLGLVINFLGNDWPKHVTIGLFESTITTRHALARNCLDKYALKRSLLMSKMKGQTSMQ
jgi:hypothetical protein